MKLLEKTTVPLLCWDICTEMLNKPNTYEELPIGGFQKQSLIDYPGNISSVIFTQGCNFNCIYCHNPQLIPFEKNKGNLMDNKKIFNWIRKNKNLLDAICITGGEPTLHRSLPDFIRTIKRLGLKIKLDTNGSNPSMLERLIEYNLVDYIAMDIKTSLSSPKYKNIAGINNSGQIVEKVRKSISVLDNSQNLEYEFRITLLDKYHSRKCLLDIIKNIKGATILQNYRHVEGVTSDVLKPFSDFEALKPFFKQFDVKFRS